MNRRQFAWMISTIAAMLMRRNPARAGVGTASPVPLDRFGDLLPSEAVARVGTIRFWDGVNGTRIESMALSPAGDLIATASYHDHVTLWETTTGAMVRRFGQPIEQEPVALLSLHAVAFDARGKSVAAARRSGLVERWEVATGRPLTPLRGHDSAVTGIAYSSDGSSMATRDRSGLILVRDPESGAIRSRLDGASHDPDRADFLSGVALSNDGSVLASCGRYQVLIWDATTGELRRALSKPLASPSDMHECLALSSDGRTAVAGGTITTAIWDVATGGIRFTLTKNRHPIDPAEPVSLGLAKISGVAISADGQILASAARMDSVRLWNLADGRQLASLDLGSALPTGVAFGPDASFVVTALYHGTIRVWDRAKVGDRVRSSGHRSEIKALAFSADGRTLVSVSNDAVCVSLAESGAITHCLPMALQASLQVTLSRDGRRLAYEDDQGPGILVVDTGSGAVVCRIAPPGIAESSVELEFSLDGATALVNVSSDEDSFVTSLLTIHDVATGAELRRLRTIEGDSFHRTQLAGDGMTLATLDYTDTELRFHDLATGRNRHRLALPLKTELIGPNSPGFNQAEWTRAMCFHSLDYAPDGRLLATRDEGGTIRIWDVDQGKQIRQFETNLGVFQGPIRFAPNGRVIATATGLERGTVARVQLWDLASGEELACFLGHQGFVPTLAFFPDGRRLASGGADTTVLIWDVARWA